MGKVSKFGIFSPAVVAAKIALGESRLNKIRGKVRTQTDRALSLREEEDIIRNTSCLPSARRHSRHYSQAVPKCQEETTAETHWYLVQQ